VETANKLLSYRQVRTESQHEANEIQLRA